MLLIRRRLGQSVLVGDAIEVTIVELQGGRVTLGLRAPSECLILRKELQQTAEANRFAARPADAGVLTVLAASLRNQTRNFS